MDEGNWKKESQNKVIYMARQMLVLASSLKNLKRGKRIKKIFI